MTSIIEHEPTTGNDPADHAPVINYDNLFAVYWHDLPTYIQRRIGEMRQAAGMEDDIIETPEQLPREIAVEIDIFDAVELVRRDYQSDESNALGGINYLQVRTIGDQPIYESVSRSGARLETQTIDGDKYDQLLSLNRFETVYFERYQLLHDDQLISLDIYSPNQPDEYIVASLQLEDAERWCREDENLQNWFCEPISIESMPGTYPLRQPQAYGRKYSHFSQN